MKAIVLSHKETGTIECLIVSPDFEHDPKVHDFLGGVSFTNRLTSDDVRMIVSAAFSIGYHARVKEELTEEKSK